MTAQNRIRRSPVALVGLIACLFGIWTAGRAGVSQLLSHRALENRSPGLAAEAIRLSPSNPQTHYVSAQIFLQTEQLANAIRELESAVSLRPDDYVLWLELGEARELNGNQIGALAAFNEAARIAPGYSRPRWQLGQFLLRNGHRDEAFAELGRAVASRPALLSAVLDLAWQAYEGDPVALQKAIQPRTSKDRFALMRFIAEHGKIVEAMELFRATGEIPDDDRRAFLNELLASKRFKEAYEVWSLGRTSEGKSRGVNTITDGSFEGEILADEPGFGWQLDTLVEKIGAVLDTALPHDSAHSLRLDFSGNATTSKRIITQLVLVEPRTTYRLSFAARAEQLITGGPPTVVVTDASSADGRTIAQSTPLPTGTVGWRDYTIEFTSREDTAAIVISVQRQNCTSDPCPIFGHAWFDSFSLQKLRP